MQTLERQLSSEKRGKYMKLMLLGIAIELFGVNFGLIGVVLEGPTYRVIVRYSAILGLLLVIIGFLLIPRKNKPDR